MEDETQGRRRRGLVLAAIVLVVGVPLMVAILLSERNVDRQADQMADELRRAGRQVDDVSTLATAELAEPEGRSGPGLADALGHGDAFVGAVFGDTEISVAYETSWGFARRCVHLLLRDGAPVRTEVTDSAACQPLALE